MRVTNLPTTPLEVDFLWSLHLFLFMLYTINFCGLVPLSFKRMTCHFPINGKKWVAYIAHPKEQRLYSRQCQRILVVPHNSHEQSLLCCTPKALKNCVEGAPNRRGWMHTKSCKTFWPGARWSGNMRSSKNIETFETSSLDTVLIHLKALFVPFFR